MSHKSRKEIVIYSALSYLYAAGAQYSGFIQIHKDMWKRIWTGTFSRQN